MMESIKMITQSELKKLFNYDPNTGLFIRRISRSNCVRVGDVAGHLCKKDGYAVININGRLYKSHWLAWLYIHGKFPKIQIDHINHIRNDNRIVNLRQSTQLENSRNASIGKNNTSGVNGVSLYKKNSKWHSKITVNSKNIHLGYFDDKFEAICARLSANNKYGFHENHGRNIK